MAYVNTQDGLFHHNEEMHCWERLDRVQNYRGHIIKTVTYHQEGTVGRQENHREYIVEFPSGRVSIFGINKRGGNIKELKEYIDFNIKHNRVEYL